jgi:hypothetical protein
MSDFGGGEMHFFEHHGIMIGMALSIYNNACPLGANATSIEANLVVMHISAAYDYNSEALHHRTPILKTLANRAYLLSIAVFTEAVGSQSGYHDHEKKSSHVYVQATGR